MDPKVVKVSSLELSHRAAAPATWDPKTNQLELTWSTAGVRMKAWRGEIGDYWEELGLDAGEVRLDRLQRSAVLKSHGRSEGDYGPPRVVRMEEQVGSVKEAWLANGAGHARVELIGRDDLKWFRDGVAEGHFRSVSVGYKVYRYRWAGDNAEDGLPIYRAIDWEPFEISFIPIPEDFVAGVRSHSGAHSTTFETHTMDPKKAGGTATTATQPGTPAANAPAQGTATELETRAATPAGGEGATQPARSEQPATPAQPAAPVAATTSTTENLATRAPAAQGPVAFDATAPAAVAERARAAEINRMAAISWVPGIRELATRAIAEGTSVEAFRAAAVERMIVAEPPAHGTGIRVLEEEGTKRFRGIEQALEYRARVSDKPTTEARPFVAMPLLRLAEEVLRIRGMKVEGIYGHDLAHRALTSSDFPLLLANTANKRLLGVYGQIPRTFLKWARRSIASDFKTKSIVRMGSGSALVKIPEDGEIPLGKLTESGDSYRVFEYGRRIALTRQLLINDDLSALDRIPAAFGARASGLESDIVYALLLSNPTLGDGVTLFHANHGNTGTGTTDITGFTAMRTAMRKQTDPDGLQINVDPRHVVVPPELETIAQQYTSAIQAQVAGNVNPFSGSFDSVQAEPRLTDANDWYGFANPDVTESLEYSYLAGAEAPQVELEEQFTSSGRQLRVLHVFGAGVADFRGAWRSVN